MQETREARREQVLFVQGVQEVREALAEELERHGVALQFQLLQVDSEWPESLEPSLDLVAMGRQTMEGMG